MNPIAGVRVGLIDGRYIINPTYDEVRESRLNLIVAGTEEAIVMVEAGASEVSEEIMVEALMLAHKEINRLCRWQNELYRALEIKKREVVAPTLNEEMLQQIKHNYGDRLRAALDTTNQEKRESYAAVDALKKDVVESYPLEDVEARQMAKTVFDHLKETIFREDILDKRRRPDGRRFSEIRPITCEVGWLPRVHGSALFTRGETQALVSTTLGTKEDEQYIDDLEKGELKRRFLLHYNFPHFSVGEIGRFGSSSRREIGHGALARRAIVLEPLLAELRARQTERDELLAAIAALEHSNVRAFDRVGVEKAVRRHVEQWRALLTTDTAAGRRFLREGLVGPLTFTPDERKYRFAGELAYSQLFSGEADQPSLVYRYGDSNPGILTENQVS